MPDHEYLSQTTRITACVDAPPEEMQGLALQHGRAREAEPFYPGAAECRGWLSAARTGCSAEQALCSTCDGTASEIFWSRNDAPAQREANR